MSRIFTVLAVVSLTLIAANLLLGLSVSDWPKEAELIRSSMTEVSQLDRTKDPAVDAAKQRRDRLLKESLGLRTRVFYHMILGIGAGIGAVLVNSISVTYFVGTSRWIKEVVETYQLEQRHIALSNRLKRRSFPWAVGGMLTVVGMVALGGAADPANSLAEPGVWSTWHLAGAFAGIGLLSASFWIQFQNITANHELIQTVMGEVQRVRNERGLETAE